MPNIYTLELKSLRVEPVDGGFAVVTGQKGTSMPYRVHKQAPTLGEARAQVGPVRTHLQAIEAEVRGSQWLADGNDARERGDKAKAERCYDKAQFWLDRYNKLTGRT